MLWKHPIPYPIQESILVGLFVGGEASKRLILFISRLRKGANESAEKGHKQVFDTISHWLLSFPYNLQARKALCNLEFLPISLYSRVISYP